MKQGTSPRFDNSWRALARPDTAEGYFHLSAVPAFEPESRAYRPANAWWLAELSRLIYRRDSRDTILARVGLCERRFFDRDSTQGALLETVPGRHAAPFAVLVFRGTLDIRDWLANLHILPWRWPGGGFVHGGFAEALDAVWDEIAAALEQVRVPLFYTGHSLGAALATLAAARMPPHAVYTFGSPRVGDAGFARHLADVPVYRLVNHCDLVPTVPPPGPLKFRHVVNCITSPTTTVCCAMYRRP